MNKIYNKIWDEAILDSEIIQETESLKHQDPKFDINSLQNGWPLLMDAVYNGREELVRYLLSDPNIVVNLRNSAWGKTALHESCCTNNIHILKLLLDHKNINVNTQDNDGWTGLHDVCWCNHIKIVKNLLLDARVNVMIRDEDGNTARDCAIRETHLEIANMLNRTECTSLLRIPNASLCRDISRMIIEEYV